MATSVNERLVKLEKDELAGRLMAIGRKSAERLGADAKQLDHGALLYDEHGLPR